MVGGVVRVREVSLSPPLPRALLQAASPGSQTAGPGSRASSPGSQTGRSPRAASLDAAVGPPVRRSSGGRPSSSCPTRARSCPCCAARAGRDGGRVARRGAACGRGGRGGPGCRSAASSLLSSSLLSWPVTSPSHCGAGGYATRHHIGTIIERPHTGGEAVPYCGGVALSQNFICKYAPGCYKEHLEVGETKPPLVV